MISNIPSSNGGFTYGLAFEGGALLLCIISMIF